MALSETTTSHTSHPTPPSVLRNHLTTALKLQHSHTHYLFSKYCKGSIPMEISYLVVLFAACCTSYLFICFRIETSSPTRVVVLESPLTSHI